MIFLALTLCCCALVSSEICLFNKCFYRNQILKLKHYPACCHTIWRKNIIVCTHYLGSFLEKWKMFGESGNQNGNLSENMCISEFWLLQANSDLECTSHIGLILRVKKFILLNFRLLKMYNTCMCQFLTSKYRKVVIRSRPRLEDALEL